jgi:hypothetical protein
MTEYENNIDELDDSWISEFEDIDKDYKYFYRENITSVKIHCIYINKNNEIEKIKQNKILLKTPNLLSKEEILYIIKHNNMETNMKYSLLSILKYNIFVEPIHLHHFLKSNKINSQYHFLTSIKEIDNISFLPCIYMFQDLNDIFIFFYQNTNEHATTTVSSKNGTKKIYIKNHKNKTFRNSL